MSMLIALMLSSITARGIINPIVVAAPAGADTALFLVTRNSSHLEDRLVRITCDCAARIEVHEARGRELVLAGESVTLPPTRLVEFRPDRRQLRLLRLRRALVAGETIPMTFHYSRGTETRDVAVVTDGGAAWWATLARDPGARRLAALQPLANACWQGRLPDGRRTELRCFTPAYGMFMQDEVTIRESGAAQTRYTLYAHDVMGMTTSFRDNGPESTLRAGRVVADGAGVIFEDYPVNADGRASTRTRWRPDGPDAWILRGEMRFPSGWRESWRMRMVRVGPAPPL